MKKLTKTILSIALVTTVSTSLLTNAYAISKQNVTVNITHTKDKIKSKATKAAIAVKTKAKPKVVVKPKVTPIPVKMSQEEKNVRAAGIVVKPVEQAIKDKEYLKSFSFGLTDKDEYIIKYYGYQNEVYKKSKLIYWRNGGMLFHTFNYKNADTMVRLWYDFSYVGNFISSDGKTSVNCWSERYSRNGDSFSSSIGTDSELLSGNPYTFVLTSFEVGYDNAKKVFYMRKATTKEYLNGKMILVSKPKGNIQKYITVLRLVVEPKIDSTTTQAINK